VEKAQTETIHSDPGRKPSVRERWSSEVAS
jgi:hypothetical protein